MRLELELPNSQAILPLPATAYLEMLKDRAFNNAAAIGLRHPYSSYGLSIGTVCEKFTAAFAALPSQPAAQQEVWAEELARTVNDVVDAVTEHFDDCQKIVGVVLDHLDERSRKKALQAYVSTVKDARDFAARQANAIKHIQGRIHLLEFSWGSNRTIGYFVEGVAADGSVGPNADVHGNTHAAYSLGRAFRYMACSVVFASRSMVSCISAHFEAHLPESAVGLGAFIDVLDHVASMDAVVFPDEGASTCPAIRKSPTKRTIRFPGTGVAWKHPPHDARVHFVMKVDPLIPSYRLPYLSDIWQKPKYRKPKRHLR